MARLLQVLTAALLLESLGRAAADESKTWSVYLQSTVRWTNQDMGLDSMSGDYVKAYMHDFKDGLLEILNTPVNAPSTPKVWDDIAITKIREQLSSNCHKEVPGLERAVHDKQQGEAFCIDIKFRVRARSEEEADLISILLDDGVANGKLETYMRKLKPVGLDVSMAVDTKSLIDHVQKYPVHVKSVVRLESQTAVDHQSVREMGMREEELFTHALERALNEPWGESDGWVMWTQTTFVMASRDPNVGPLTPESLDNKILWLKQCFVDMITPVLGVYSTDQVEIVKMHIAEEVEGENCWDIMATSTTTPFGEQCVNIKMRLFVEDQFSADKVVQVIRNPEMSEYIESYFAAQGSEMFAGYKYYSIDSPNALHVEPDSIRVWHSAQSPSDTASCDFSKGCVDVSFFIGMPDPFTAELVKDRLVRIVDHELCSEDTSYHFKACLNRQLLEVAFWSMKAEFAEMPTVQIREGDVEVKRQASTTDEEQVFIIAFTASAVGAALLCAAGVVGWYAYKRANGYKWVNLEDVPVSVAAAGSQPQTGKLGSAGSKVFLEEAGVGSKGGLPPAFGNNFYKQTDVVTYEADVEEGGAVGVQIPVRSHGARLAPLEPQVPPSTSRFAETQV